MYQLCKSVHQMATAQRTHAHVTRHVQIPHAGPLPSSMAETDRNGARLRQGAGVIIRLIIQTIRRDPSGPDATDGPSHLSRLDPSGADQIDAEHQATDLAVGGSNPSRRATKPAGQRPVTGPPSDGSSPDCDPIATPLAGTPDTAATPCDPIAHTDAASPR